MPTLLLADRARRDPARSGSSRPRAASTPPRPTVDPDRAGRRPRPLRRRTRRRDPRRPRRPAPVRRRRRHPRRRQVPARPLGLAPRRRRRSGRPMDRASSTARRPSSTDAAIDDRRPTVTTSPCRRHRHVDPVGAASTSPTDWFDDDDPPHPAALDQRARHDRRPSRRHRSRHDRPIARHRSRSQSSANTPRRSPTLEIGSSRRARRGRAHPRGRPRRSSGSSPPNGADERAHNPGLPFDHVGDRSSPPVASCWP